MKLSSITHALLLSGLSIAAAACSDAHAMERLGASDEALTASAPSTIQVIDPVQVAAPAAAAQTGSGVRTALVLDGFPIAWTTASGGTAVGTVITDSTSRKRIGSVRRRSRTAGQRVRGRRHGR